MVRVRAGISYALTEAMDEGHCGLPTEELTSSPKSCSRNKALPWVEGRIGLALAESQVAAIRLVLMSKVLVMTGGPGVGKTSIVNAILRILAAKGRSAMPRIADVSLRRSEPPLRVLVVL
jgi:ATP-dependent exoDNAse (exonuclease V) alpha subunit